MSKFIGTFSHEIENRTFTCHLYKVLGNRAKIAIKDGEVRIYCPEGVDHRFISNFLNQAKDFLLRNTRSDGKVLDLSASSGVAGTLRGLGGVDLPLFAETYTCRFAGPANTPKIEISGHEALLFCRPELDLRLAMVAALKSMTVEMATSLMSKYEDILMLRRPFRVEARKLVGKWGCCHTSGLIELDWRAAFLPPHLFGYLVAHEFSHLKEMNHSRRFWNTVKLLHPNFKQEDHELDHWLKMLPKV